MSSQSKCFLCVSASWRLCVNCCPQIHALSIGLINAVRFICLFASAAAGIGTGRAAESAPGLPPDYKLLCQQDFEKPGAIKDFVFTDAKAWKVSETNGNSSLELFA